MSTSRIFQPANERFGLFAIAESRRVVLPLKGVECEFSVRGGVVEVCLGQIFRQQNPKPLDCEYLFPLPADAAVYSCEADVNGRIIRAEIKERQEARRIAAEKKAEGFRTALVESERDNLFTLSLGNVQPDDLIIVRLKYFQPLRASDQLRSIEIPFCPGVRYIPGQPLLRTNRGKGTVDDTDEVPDASRITPVRIDADHPDAAYIDVRGKLDAAYADQQSLTSPSHSIEVRTLDGELCVTLSSKGEIPDRDFVLRWNERNADAVAPRAWAREKGNEIYALLEVRAPAQVSAQPTALDFYFLVDRSGSMKGAKWCKAVEALQSCLPVLGPDDRAMVTLFETSFRDFAEEPLPVREIIKDPQFQKLNNLDAAGGTNLSPALKHVLEIAAKKSKGRPKNLILITDAQIGNETAILDLMKTAPDMPVHCFGIDIALNDALLLALSRQQGGTFHSLNPNDDIPAAVAKIGKTLRLPVLFDLQLAEGWECAEAKIPNLYAGQILYLSARGNAEKPLALTARTASGEPFSFHFPHQPRTDEVPYLHWCKSRIQRRLAEGLAQEAIALSVASNLLCRLTAFVAWDDSEKVIVSRHALVQPNMPVPGTVKMAGMENLYSTSRSRNKMCKELPGQFGGGAAFLSLGAGGSYPERLLQNLSAVCQRLGGDDWKPSLATIETWFVRPPVSELRRTMDSAARLILKLTICSNLLEALREDGLAGSVDLVQRLRICALPFDRRLRLGNGTDGDFKDLEEVVRMTETVDATASAEKLSLLAKAIHRRAVEMLKTFAESLLAGK
jgi:Ca-activated chloride channel homolog